MRTTVEAKCFRLWIHLLKNAPTSVQLLLKGQSGYVFDHLFNLYISSINAHSLKPFSVVKAIVTQMLL